MNPTHEVVTNNSSSDAASIAHSTFQEATNDPITAVAAVAHKWKYPFFFHLYLPVYVFFLFNESNSPPFCFFATLQKLALVLTLGIRNMIPQTHNTFLSSMLRCSVCRPKYPSKSPLFLESWQGTSPFYAFLCVGGRIKVNTIPNTHRGGDGSPFTQLKKLQKLSRTLWLMV